MPEEEEVVAQAVGADPAEPAIPGILKHPVGEIPTTNAKTDAPTILIDSVQGAMVSNITAKISFIEHFLSENFEINGRYVLNLAMPFGQMRAVGELFIRLSDDADRALAADQADGN